jgi:hypothetical protein
MRSSTASPRPARPWLPFAAWAVGALLAATSIGGLLLPSTYARETASWRAQGIGQDGFDLLVVVPVLLAAGALADRSRGARVLLGGALLYAAYSFVLYAFDVHFNSLFLVYCAGLGASVLSLARFLAEEVRDPGPAPASGPARAGGALLLASSLLFALLWLSDVVPALARGTAPASLAEGGFFTNPVQVLDLSLVLPAMAASGVSLWRGGTVGRAVAPVMLAFGVLMPLAIVAMIVSMRHHGVPAGLGPALPLAALAGASAAALRPLLRRPPPDPDAPGSASGLDRA